MITEPDWKGHVSNPDGRVIIGDNTEIKEFVVINKPTDKVTSIGKDCYIMSHVFLSAMICDIGGQCTV